MNLSGTRLQHAILTDANLYKADLNKVQLGKTVFGNTDLTDVLGLEACVHRGPSVLDFSTLAKSGHLPLAFLRGCGLPDTLTGFRALPERLQLFLKLSLIAGHVSKGSHAEYVDIAGSSSFRLSSESIHDPRTFCPGVRDG